MLRRIALTSAFACGIFLMAQPPVQRTVANAPVYTKEGNITVPNYREWVYLTSGIDMTYNTPAAGAAAPKSSVFDNVFVNPESYRAFLATGTWPDKTTFILENRIAENPVSINKAGHTQSTEIRGVELHVKDNNKWTFYVAGKAAEGKPLPASANCYTCHQDHGAVDTTFTQFYPTLLPIAREKKTLSPQYLSESAAETSATTK